MTISTITLFFNDQQVDLPLGKMSFFDELYVDVKWIKEKDHQRLKIEIHPKETIVLKDLLIQIPFPFKRTDRVFCNGFQSWSESWEFEITEKISPLHPLAKPFYKYTGDQHLSNLTTKTSLYSWTYG